MTAALEVRYFSLYQGLVKLGAMPGHMEAKMEADLAGINIDAAHPFSEPPRVEGAKRFTIGVEVRIESRRNKKSGKYIICDGRLCLSCGCKGCDPDWAVPDEPKMWGRPVRPNGHNPPTQMI